MTSQPPHAEFNLLFPADCLPPERPEKDVAARWGEYSLADLGIDEVVLAISPRPRYREIIRTILTDLNADIRVIAYRHQALADFLETPGLADGFAALLPQLARLHDIAGMQPDEGEIPLNQVLSRLTELNTYVACVRKLQALLEAAGPALQSDGLRGLRDHLTGIAADETFRSIERALPDLIARITSIPSLTIGINLDSEFRPVEATLLSVNDKPFKDGSLLDQLLGRTTGQGIAPLHAVPFQVAEGLGRSVRSPTRMDPMLVPLFKDLSRVLKAVINPIAAALKQYAQVNVRFLAAIEAHVAFYLGAAALIQKMRAAGLAMCCPESLPAAERVCQMQGMYNLRLALRLASESTEANLGALIVPNDVDFGPQGRIFILTGPNQGGKTIYTQAVGLAQVLYQAGLYVPAEKARLSPVDGIYTHFVSVEKLEPGTGRLAEEAARLSKIFQAATSHSLVLLNETLSSTSPGESLYLARDIVSALRLFGVRAIFATHLHELAESIDVINADVAGDSRLVSLVAGAAGQDGKAEPDDDNVIRTYKIQPGPPRGLSYAKSIASRYGISFEQLAGRQTSSSWENPGKVENPKN